MALCLSILALRVTYTESPTAQVLTTPGSLGDMVYSLTLSGLLIFAFVLWLLWGIFTGRLVYRFTGIEIGLAVFGLASVVSAWGASDKREAITQIVTLLGPLFAALLLVQILDHPAKVRVVLVVLVGLGIVSAYQCAEQFFISNAATIEQYEKDPQMLLEPLGIQTGTFQHFLFEHRLYSRGVRGFFTTSNSAASFAILACAAAADTAPPEAPRLQSPRGRVSLWTIRRAGNDPGRCGAVSDAKQRRHPGILRRAGPLRTADGP